MKAPAVASATLVDSLIHWEVEAECREQFIKESLSFIGEVGRQP